MPLISFVSQPVKHLPLQMLRHDLQLFNNLFDDRNIHAALLVTIVHRLPRERYERVFKCR